METITRWRRPAWNGTTVDSRGNPVLGAATSTTLGGWAVAPRYSTEDNQGRQGVVIGLTLFGPPLADVRPSDQFEVRGEMYEVDGQPGDWRHPWTGVPAGVQVAVKRVEG
jgi:hypothetical protein